MIQTNLLPGVDLILESLVPDQLHRLNSEQAQSILKSENKIMLGFVVQHRLAIGLAFFFLLAVEITAHFISEHIGAPRKQAMLQGMTIDHSGNKKEDQTLKRGTNVQYLSAEDRVIFSKEYDDIVRNAIYSQRSIFNFAPNYRGKFIITDERGFRLVPAALVSSGLRVVFLGGSITWGTSAETNADTIPAYFQSLSKGRFETVNYGMGGYSTTEGLLNLSSALVRDHPDRKIDAVIVSDMWNDCISSVLRLSPPSPFATDGLGPAVSGAMSLFIVELQKRGMMVFSLSQALHNTSLWISKFFTSTIPGIFRHVIERERVWRLIRLLRDPNFLPWYCCGKEDETESLMDPLTLVPKAYFDAAVEKSLDVYENNLIMMRALAQKYKIQIFFTINPMAFTKKNPAAGEYMPTLRDNFYAACYDRARIRFAGVADIIDMTDTPMPNDRTFADTGHMNRLGNRAYAVELLKKIGPRIDARFVPN